MHHVTCPISLIHCDKVDHWANISGVSQISKRGKIKNEWCALSYQYAVVTVDDWLCREENVYYAIILANGEN